VADIVALGGSFQDARAFLHHIAQDDEIEGLAIVIFRKDGSAVPVHLNCKARDMAFAGMLLSSLSIEI